MRKRMMLTVLAATLVSPVAWADDAKSGQTDTGKQATTLSEMLKTVKQVFSPKAGSDTKAHDADKHDKG